MSNVAILGLSADYHDAAACLVVDGEIVAAAEEERFTRKKHDASLPVRAMQYCLLEGNVSRIDAVAFYDKPIRKLHRILETSLGVAPRGVGNFVRAIPVWIREKLWVEARVLEALAKLGVKGPGAVAFTEHHQAHAASAFYPSPFEEAAVLTLDGVGEWATTTVGVGEGHRLELLEELHFPHSLGLLYSAFTHFCGFEVNEGEYKLMGLAPYGRARYRAAIEEHLLDLKPDGSFRLRVEHFGYLHGRVMTGRSFERLFDGPARHPDAPITDRERDLARSVQEVTEEVVLRIAAHAREVTCKKRLCLAGGVALNCVANGRLVRSGLFDDLFIQPAAGDAGGALGAALAVWHERHGASRVARESMRGAMLGPSFAAEDIRHFLDANGITYGRYDDDGDWANAVATLLSEQQVVGLFQGRMEFGPRALGNRSIVADPRSATMRDRVNEKIKAREGFRPFAPAVLDERARDHFDLEVPSPYMLLTAQVRTADLPAITHVDGSARVQTVSRAESPRFHRLLTAFEARTGCPVLLNTSFNVRGEPIVCTPEDAYRCFLRSGMDALSLGPFLVLADPGASNRDSHGSVPTNAPSRAIPS